MSMHGRPISVGPAPPKGRLRDELRALKSLAPYLWPRESFGLRARVVRHHPEGFGVQFIDIQNPAALRRYFG